MPLKIKLIFPKNFKIKILKFKTSSEIEILEPILDKGMATPRETSIRETKASAQRSFGDRLFGFK